MKTTERRYDIDWLRVIAIGLLLIYHIGIAFQPWGVFIGFIQSDHPIEQLWIPMSMLNVWRIPLLFFVSGMGVCFAIRRRNWKQLLVERARRILLPFLFGILAIVPVHLYIWQTYYNQETTFSVQPVHLWFLANIFIYVVILSPLFFYLKKKAGSSVHSILIKLFETPIGMLAIIGLFVLEVIILDPETFGQYAMTLHGFILGMLSFLFGFLFIYAGDTFWSILRRWSYPFLALAIGLFLVRVLVFELLAPNSLIAAESCSWIFGVLGTGYRYLNRPGRTLAYLNSAAYPVYILHMIFLYLGSMVIFPLPLPSWLEFILVVLFTFAGCFAFYELVVRRIWFIRPLFGLRPERNKRARMVLSEVSPFQQ